jgi:hypothetical protein
MKLKCVARHESGMCNMVRRGILIGRGKGSTQTTLHWESFLYVTSCGHKAFSAIQTQCVHTDFQGHLKPVALLNVGNGEKTRVIAIDIIRHRIFSCTPWYEEHGSALECVLIRRKPTMRSCFYTLGVM